MLLKDKIILYRFWLIFNSKSIAPFNSSINAGFVPNARILAVTSESRAVFRVQITNVSLFHRSGSVILTGTFYHCLLGFHMLTIDQTN